MLSFYGAFPKIICNNQMHHCQSANLNSAVIVYGALNKIKHQDHPWPRVTDKKVIIF